MLTQCHRLRLSTDNLPLKVEVYVRRYLGIYPQDRAYFVCHRSLEYDAFYLHFQVS